MTLSNWHKNHARHTAAREALDAMTARASRERTITGTIERHQDRLIANADKLDQITVGMQVWVRPAFGTQPAVHVTVTEVHEDIKRGRPGICYDDRWAYLDQVSLTGPTYQCY